MADPKQTQAKKILNRCAERVTLARIAPDWAGTFMFGGQSTLYTEGKMDGAKVDAMALHPAGLAVEHKGKRYVVPGARVDFVVVAEEEA